MTSPLEQYVDTWRAACADFVSLVRTLPDDDAQRPTDLPGWTVADVVAHTAHLESVLAHGEEPPVEIGAAEHVRGAMGRYTEQGVVSRRGRSLGELADEIEHAVATRGAALEADPPQDPAGTPPRTFADVPWTNEILLGNRPLDVWIHEQDIRRAVGRPGGYDSAAAAHTVDRLAASLPMVLGKRVSPPPGTTLRMEIPESDRAWTLRVGDDGRVSASTEQPEVPPDDESTTTITLPVEDFVVLASGRRTPEQTTPAIVGDERLAKDFLAAMAVTP